MLGEHPDCVPLLSFSNSLLMPGSTVQVTLDGFQGFTLVGEVTKNGGHVGIVQALESLEDKDLFTTGTLARLSVADLTQKSITVNLQGLLRFDIEEFIKTPQSFYAARVRYKHDEPPQNKADVDPSKSLLDKFQKLLTCLECMDEDVVALDEYPHENLLGELADLYPSGEFANQYALEPSALEHQSKALHQYMEDAMLSPLVGFTRH